VASTAPPVPMRRCSAETNTVPEMALPRACAASAWSVSAVTARHGWLPSTCDEMATPRSNHAELALAGPVTSRNAASSRNTAGISGDEAWRDRSRVGRGGQSRFSAS